MNKKQIIIISIILLVIVAIIITALIYINISSKRCWSFGVNKSQCNANFLSCTWYEQNNICCGKNEYVSGSLSGQSICCQNGYLCD